MIFAEGDNSTLLLHDCVRWRAQIALAKVLRRALWPDMGLFMPNLLENEMPKRHVGPNAMIQPVGEWRNMCLGKNNDFAGFRRSGSCHQCSHPLRSCSQSWPIAKVGIVRKVIEPDM